MSCLIVHLLAFHWKFKGEDRRKVLHKVLQYTQPFLSDFHKHSIILHKYHTEEGKYGKYLMSSQVRDQNMTVQQ